MTSIIKVDTIQDTAGNNIINENSNTITIGASGDTITIPSGATITNSGTATGFGESNTPAFQMRRDSDQTGLSDNSAVKIIFNQDVIDTDSATDTSTGRFTVPSGKAGNYFLYGYVSVYSAGNIRGGSLRMYKNGSAVYFPQWQFGQAQSQGVFVTSGILNLSASDYVELYANINVDSGTSDLANSNGYNNIFGGFKL